MIVQGYLVRANMWRCFALPAAIKNWRCPKVVVFMYLPVKVSIMKAYTWKYFFYNIEGWTRYICPSHKILFNQCHHFIFWSHRWVFPIPMNRRYSKFCCQQINKGNRASHKLITRLLIVYVSIFDWYHDPTSPSKK